MTYFRAIDPLPLQSAEHTQLHEVYTRLGAGRLSATRCRDCGCTAWPPRGFCPECGAAAFDWVDLPAEGTVHAFTVQETGLPAGIEAPRIFAIVKVGEHRVFTVLVDAVPAEVRLGQRVRLAPFRVADDPAGSPRWLPGFRPV